MRSKSVFLKRFGVCLVIFCFGYWFYDGMLKEKDVDGVVIVGLFSGITMMIISAIIGLIWVVWAIITSRPIYKCAYCKNIFEIPVFKQWLATDEDRLRTIRKMNIKR